MNRPEKTKFARFGPLKPLKQKHYIADENEKSFHNPPVRYGFYAFPEHYIEPFLFMNRHPGHFTSKSKWIKDEKGELVEAKFTVKDHTFNPELLLPEIKRLLKRQKINLRHILFFQKKERKRFCRCSYDWSFDCQAEGNEKEKAYCEKYEASPEYLAAFKKPHIFSFTEALWHHLGDHLRPVRFIDQKGYWVKTSYPDYLSALEKERHRMLREYHGNQEWNSDFKARLGNSEKSGYGWDHLEVFIDQSV